MGRRRMMSVRYAMPTFMFLAKPIAAIGSAVSSYFGHAISIGFPIILNDYVKLGSFLFLEINYHIGYEIDDGEAEYFAAFILLHIFVIALTLVLYF